MAAKVIRYIDVKKIPGLAPALRSVKAQNFVKNFLHVVSVNEFGGWDGAGRVSFYPMGESDEMTDPTQAAPYWSQPHGVLRRVYKHELPMQPLVCLSRMSEDVAAFEGTVDDVFFRALRGLLPKDAQVYDDTFLSCLQAAKHILELKLHPVHGYYKRQQFEHNNGMQKYFAPRRPAIFRGGESPKDPWRHDPGYMVVTSTKEHCGVMTTSPLHVEIEVEIPILKLTLSKALGFLIDPTTFIECHAKEAKDV